MTFRAQLLRTFFLLVLITTVASLWVAQQQNSTLFQILADRIFSEQMRTLRQAQELPIQAAKLEVQRLAQSVRLYAALEEGDAELIYQTASDELRLGDFAFFRLLDKTGKMLPPTSSTLAGVLDEKEMVGGLLPDEQRMSPGKVSLGFTATRHGEVYRLLACDIESFNQKMGTLVLGQPMPKDAAILLGKNWLGDGIPQPWRAPLLSQTSASGGLAVEGQTLRYTMFPLNEGSAYPQARWVSVLTMDELARQQRQLTQRIVLIGVGILLLALFAARALSRKLAEPIAHLVEAAHQVQGGEYHIHIPASGTQEVDQLGTAFNEMASGLALRDKYHSVLQKVTDPRVAEELVAGRVKLGGETREVSILFCDIRGYTSLSAGRDPVEVIELLNTHMGALAAEVQKHHGVINQYAGDALMVLFGAPKSYGNDAEHAVRCAWAMMQARLCLNATALEPMEIGIGVATGRVVVGCIGSENRNDYTAVGEKVNLAARLCSSAYAGQILLDAETHAKAAGVGEVAEVPPLMLKGFAQPVPAYALEKI